MSQKYNIDTYVEYNIVSEFSSEYITNYEDNIYNLSLPVSKIIDKYYQILSFEYLGISDLDVKVTIKDNNIDTFESSYKISDSIYTHKYVFSNFNKVDVEISEEAKNARHKELDWHSCRE